MRIVTPAAVHSVPEPISRTTAFHTASGAGRKSGLIAPLCVITAHAPKNSTIAAN